MASWSLSRARRSASCTVRTSVLLKSMMTTSSPRTSTRSHRPRSSVDPTVKRNSRSTRVGTVPLCSWYSKNRCRACRPSSRRRSSWSRLRNPVDPRALEGGQELLQGHGLAPRLPAVVLLHRFVDGRPVHHAVVPHDRDAEDVDVPVLVGAGHVVVHLPEGQGEHVVGGREEDRGDGAVGGRGVALHGLDGGGPDLRGG